MNIRKSIFAGFAVVLLSALNSSALMAATPDVLLQADVSKTGSVTAESKSTNGDIVEILPEDFKPAFTRDTVIKLNAIVKRSYAVIEGFDDFKRELNSATMHKVGTSTGLLSESQTVAITALEQHSNAAVADMREAVKALKVSDEYYNVAVLAGMTRFVEAVDKEISVFVAATDAVDATPLK